MMKQEFETLTGLTVTNDDYAKIESLYYTADNMQKDVFCDLYKQLHDNQLFQIIADKLILSRKANKAYQKDEDEVIELLTLKAAEHDDDELEKKARAISPWGRKTTIKIKIDNNIDLSQDDLEYVREHLR